MNMNLASPLVVRRNDWLFKVSVNNDEGIILVHAYNETFMWSQIRFFDSENTAKNWVDYLVMQVKDLQEK
jgi:hypothetical protein